MNSLLCHCNLLIFECIIMFFILFEDFLILISFHSLISCTLIHLILVKVSLVSRMFTNPFFHQMDLIHNRCKMNHHSYLLTPFVLVLLLRCLFLISFQEFEVVIFSLFIMGLIHQISNLQNLFPLRVYF